MVKLSKMFTFLRTNEDFQRTIVAFYVTLFFLLTLLVFGPSNIYLTNPMEFNFFYYELMLFLIPIALVCIVVITIILSVLIKKAWIHQKVISSLFALSVLLWLQGNILVWNYGLLDGMPINWNAKMIYGIIDSPIWILLVIIAIMKSSFIYRIAKTASLAFILIQTIWISSLVFQQPVAPSFKRYSADDTDKFRYSKAKNAIILVLDSFQLDVFHEIINEDGYYKDIFDGFTFFRNALGGYAWTLTSVPLILTGEYYDYALPFEQWKEDVYSSNSIPRVLKLNDYRVGVFRGDRSMYLNEDIASNFRKRSVGGADVLHIYDLSLFRYMPHFVKKNIYNGQRWFLRRIFEQEPFDKDKNTVSREPSITTKYFSEKALRNLSNIRYINSMLLESSVDSNQPTFKYYHLWGLHAPLKMNEELEYEPIMRVNRDNYKKSAKGLLEIVKLFLDRLTELGVYDNSLIFIVADHGAGNQGQELIIQEGMVTDEEATEISSESQIFRKLRLSALPLVLVKKIESKGALKISDAPISLSDISATVFSELGIVVDGPGDSMFEIKESSTRGRRFLFNGSTSNGRHAFTPMFEYMVFGYSWLDSSWRLTERVFLPKGGVERGIYSEKIRRDLSPSGLKDADAGRKD